MMISLQSLGTALIRVGPAQVRPSQPRRFALLLHLIAERGHRISRAELQALIFSDKEEQRGRHSLRELVYEIRQLGVRIVSDPSGIELAREDLSADYDGLIGANPPTLEQLQAAARGFLPGYAPDHSEAYSDWLAGFRARTIFALCQACLREVRRAREAADWACMERAARACLALEPLNDEGTLALAEAIAIGGSRTQADRLLDSYMKEVGNGAPQLRLHAVALKRRIGEQLREVYHPHMSNSFVGRDADLASLREAFRVVCRSAAGCVIVGGEPGIGKTRLTTEFCNIAILEGSRVQRVNMQPLDADRPMGAFVDLVPVLLRLPGAIGCAPESMSALRRLTERESTSAEALSTAPEMEALSFAITHAIGDLCESVASESPLVIVIEDAHWLDQLSRRTIGSIVSSRSRSRILFVATTREPRELMTELRHVNGVRSLVLRRLDESALATLVHEALVASPGVPDDVCSQIISTSAGNPLFAISLAAQCRASGNTFVIPATLRDLLIQRLGPLSDRARSVLQTCIAFGNYCTTERLIASLQLPHADLLDAIAALSDASLLELTDEVIRPAHPLITEVLRERTSPLMSKLVSFKVASVLQEEADRTHSPSLMWQAAELWLDANEQGRGFGALRECARHAIEIGRPGEAARILSRACELQRPPEERLAAAYDLVRAADLAYENELVLAGVKILRSCGRRDEHDDIEMAEVRATVTAFDTNVTAERHLLNCVRAGCANPEHRVIAATWLLKFADIAGNRELLHRGRRALPPEDLEAVDRLHSLEFELVYRSASGDSSGAADVASELLREAITVSPARRVSYERNAALALWRANRSRAAILAFEQHYATAVEMGARRYQFFGAAYLASSYFDLDDDALADTWLARCAALLIDEPERKTDFTYVAICLDIALTRRHPEAGRIAAEAEALGVWEQTDLRRRIGRAIQLRVRAIQGRCTQSDAEEAQALASNVLDSVTRVRDIEMVAACEAFVRLGRAADARTALSEYVANGGSSAGPMSRALRQVCSALGLAPL